MSSSQPDSDIVERTSPLTGETLRYRKLPDGKLRDLRYDRGHAPRESQACATLVDPQTFADGSTRYLNQEKPDAPIEDLRDERARKEWHRYARYRNAEGRLVEGPLGFQSRAEKEEYYRRFGWKDKDRGQDEPDSHERFRRWWAANKEQIRARLKVRLSRMSPAQKLEVLDRMRAEASMKGVLT